MEPHASLASSTSAPHSSIIVLGPSAAPVASAFVAFRDWEAQPHVVPARKPHASRRPFQPPCVATSSQTRSATPPLRQRPSTELNVPWPPNPRAADFQFL